MSGAASGTAVLRRTRCIIEIRVMELWDDTDTTPGYT